MSACAQELVLHSLQLSQNKYDSRPRPELRVAQHPSHSWTCMPWTEGFRLVFNICSCVQWSHSPGLYSGIPSLSCSLSHLPTSQCTYTPAALPLEHIKSKNDEKMVDEAEQGPTPTSPAASPVEVAIELDVTTEAEENDDVMEVEPAKTWQGEPFQAPVDASQHRRIGGHQVRQPPA